MSVIRTSRIPDIIYPVDVSQAECYIFMYKITSSSVLIRRAKNMTSQCTKYDLVMF